MDAAVIVPEISVIIPARNEEVSLSACLQSIVSQRGVPFEVIVVDDGSTDRTSEIAKSFTNVRLIQSGSMPQGWSGKNNAVCCGASVARGEWLLFTDADTVHLSGSLARSLTEAKKRNVDMLSYSPEQDIRSVCEKAVMPVIFAELAGTYCPQEVSDPNSPVAAANGQYILVCRAAYDAVGGHASVAASVLEDVALASVMKRSGRRIFFRYGGDAVRTRMYRSYAQLREGWTKNLALLFPSPGRVALLRMGEFTLIVGSALLAVSNGLSGRTAWAIVLAVLATVMEVFLLLRIRKAHFSWEATGLSLLGLPLFCYLLMRSQRFHKRGSVTWKGRDYNINIKEQQANPSARPCLPQGQP